VPQTAFVNWIYVRQWIAFMYVGAETVDHRWTAPKKIALESSSET